MTLTQINISLSAFAPENLVSRDGFGNPVPLCDDHTYYIPGTTNSRCGKREAHINWSMVIPEKAAPATGTTALRTTGPPLWWRTLGSERHWYAITSPGELKADVMAVGGIEGGRCGNWEESRELSTRFTLNVENEQTDAGQDDRTRLARPNPQVRTATPVKYSFSLFS